MKKIVLGTALVLAGLGVNAHVGNQTSENQISEAAQVIAADTARVRMSLPKAQIVSLLQGMQLPQEIVDALMAPEVETVGMSINADDMRYLLEALGLDPNMVQKDPTTGTAKLGMTQSSGMQLLGLLQAFPGVMTIQMDLTTKQSKLNINTAALQEMLKGITLNPEMFDLLSDAEGKNLTVVMETENVRALADGLKAVVAKNTAATGGKPDMASLMKNANINLTQNIKDPITVSSTTDKVKVYGFTLNNNYCNVILDVTACKGKLKGVDKTAYFEVDGVKYPLKGVKETTVPEDPKTAMEWDAAQTSYLTLEFQPIKMKRDSKMVLVLSTADNGVRIETRFRTN